MDTQNVKYVGRRAEHPLALEIKVGEWPSLAEAQRALAPGVLWRPSHESLRARTARTGPLALRRLLRPTRWCVYGDDDSILIIEVQPGEAAPPALDA